MPRKIADVANHGPFPETCSIMSLCLRGHEETSIHAIQSIWMTTLWEGRITKCKEIRALETEV